MDAPARSHRQLRLTRSDDIRAAFRRGKRLGDPHLRAVVRVTDQDGARLCIQVGRKISKKAVVRNRIRRRTREALKGPLSRCRRSVDVVVMAQRSVAELPWPELVARCHKLVQRIEGA